VEYRASFVIPAHNEERRMRGLLSTLTASGHDGHYAIYVVCNGCTDRTREVAMEYPGVEAVEIDQTGKHFALNEGDRLAGQIFPRFYCDADVQISSSSISSLVECLSSGGVLAAGPSADFETAGRSWGMRLYVKSLHGPIVANWADSHLVGRGMYGVSRAGRERFLEFPSLIADDKFFDDHFTSSEKVVVRDARVTIWTTNTLSELIRNEARVVQGNRQMSKFHAERMHDETSGGAVVALEEPTHHPAATIRQWLKEFRFRDALPLAVYVSVKLLSRLYLATMAVRRKSVGWR